METELQPNQGKHVEIDVADARYARFPIKTRVITDHDAMERIVTEYAAPHLQPGDFLFISERVVAITQGRAFPIKDIHPSRLAQFLVKFVHKSPYGIGLGSPWTMELAIREAGVMRMLFAAFISAITKPFGVRGLFYKVVGKNINAIDGPCSYTLPPYNEYAKLGPKNPNGVARELAQKCGARVVIIDANDLGVAILGKSEKNIPDDLCKQVFRDNPLGQSSEQTPLCIVRKL
ncbi:MAG: coenzyme F420-0:L-glutamate ligase [Candidatus Magasanikbacteria bacterium]|nr:coenzyme F420-0:L-glutamate ligase [Candidatus Magasanikbacteria bacterium]